MNQTIFRNGFFAFLAMILMAVGTILVVNAPPASSHPAAASDGDDFAPAEADSTPVVDARIEHDTPST